MRFFFTDANMVRKVTIPMLDREGRMSDNVGLTLRCNGEEGGEDVITKRGWTKEQGPALTLMASTKEGKITGMFLKTFGEQITVAWEVGQLWADIGKVKDTRTSEVI